ncbi:CBS domain-containing protein [Neptunomonas sp.]|uniref:CBS domain-containing protein n=1 Tax=Neptunomonas sp. TaxID=1971898 RepID=UPI0025FD3F15|nr:CBS domain-containing protein [Neptunomonas sp.]
MLEAFRHIRLQEIAEVTHLLSPEQVQAPISLNSSAVDVMTDFQRVEPVTISQETQIDEALEWMKNQHVRLLFATAESNSISGVVTARDIMGSRVMSYMQTHGLSREFVLVKHVMAARAQLQALTHEQLIHSKIGDVMLTLKDSGEQHILVIDEGLAQVKRIRGIISASDVSRKLKIGFEIMYEAKSFAEIERVVTHGGGI